MVKIARSHIFQGTRIPVFYWIYFLLNTWLNKDEFLIKIHNVEDEKFKLFDIIGHSFIK